MTGDAHCREAETDLHQWLHELADELGEDSSGDGGEERDPIGVGWERACKHYAEAIRKKLAELGIVNQNEDEPPRPTSYPVFSTYSQRREVLNRVTRGGDE